MQFYPLIDTRPTCHEVAVFLETHIGLFVQDPVDADCFLIGGGDGWMLDTMRKWSHRGIPFLGVNCGTRGFLLNTFDEELLTHMTWESLDIVDVTGVDVTIQHTDGSKEQGFFFNDITLGGSVLDYFSFDVETEEKHIQTKGTGLVVCTPLGSTGYALNLGQPMIPLQSNMWGVSGIATFPFHYTFLQPQELTIRMTGRSPGLLGLDGYNATHKDIAQVTLRPSTQQAKLAFLKQQPFAEKRLLLAEEKLGK